MLEARLHSKRQDEPPFSGAQREPPSAPESLNHDQAGSHKSIGAAAACIPPLTDPIAQELWVKFWDGQLTDDDLPDLELPPHLECRPFCGYGPMLIQRERQQQHLRAVVGPSQPATAGPLAKHPDTVALAGGAAPLPQLHCTPALHQTVTTNGCCAPPAPELGTSAAAALAPLCQGPASPQSASMAPITLLGLALPSAFRTADDTRHPPGPSGPEVGTGKVTNTGSGLQTSSAQQQQQTRVQQTLPPPPPPQRQQERQEAEQGLPPHPAHNTVQVQQLELPQLPMGTVVYQRQHLEQILQRHLHQQGPPPPPLPQQQMQQSSTFTPEAVHQQTEDLSKMRQLLLEVLHKQQNQQQQEQVVPAQAPTEQQAQHQSLQSLQAVSQVQAPAPPQQHLPPYETAPGEAKSATLPTQHHHPPKTPAAAPLAVGARAAMQQPPPPVTASEPQPHPAAPTVAPAMASQATAPALAPASLGASTHEGGGSITTAAAAPTETADPAAQLAACLRPYRPLHSFHKISRVKAVLALEMSRAWDELCAAHGGASGFGSPEAPTRAQLQAFGRTAAELDDAYRERFPPHPPGRMEYISVTVMYQSVGKGIVWRGLRGRPDSRGVDIVLAPRPTWGRERAAVMEDLTKVLLPMEEATQAEAEQGTAGLPAAVVARERRAEGQAGPGQREGQQGRAGWMGPREMEDGARESGVGMLAGGPLPPPPPLVAPSRVRKRLAEGALEDEQVPPGSGNIHTPPPVHQLQHLRQYLRLALVPQLKDKNAKPLPLASMLKGFRGLTQAGLTQEMVSSAGFTSVLELLQNGLSDVVRVVVPEEPGGAGGEGGVVLVPADAYRNDRRRRVMYKGLHRQPQQPSNSPQHTACQLQSHGSSGAEGPQLQPLAAQQQVQQQPAQQQEQGQAVRTGETGSSGVAGAASGAQPTRCDPSPAQGQAPEAGEGQPSDTGAVAAATGAASVQISGQSGGGGGGGGSSASASGGSSAAGLSLSLSRGPAAMAASRRRQALPAHLRPKPPRPSGPPTAGQSIEPGQQQQQSQVGQQQGNTLTAPAVAGFVIGAAPSAGQGVPGAAGASAPPGGALGALPMPSMVSGMPPVAPLVDVTPRPAPAALAAAAAGAALPARAASEVLRNPAVGVTIQLDNLEMDQAVARGAGGAAFCRLGLQHTRPAGGACCTRKGPG